MLYLPWLLLKKKLQDEKFCLNQEECANGMADSLLRGTGIPGAITAQVKNALMVINSESSKKNPKYSKAIKEASQHISNRGISSTRK